MDTVKPGQHISQGSQPLYPIPFNDLDPLSFHHFLQFFYHTPKFCGTKQDWKTSEISLLTGIYLNTWQLLYEIWLRFVGIPLVQFKNICHKDRSAIMWQINNKENGNNFITISICLMIWMEMYSLRTTYLSKGVMLQFLSNSHPIYFPFSLFYFFLLCIAAHFHLFSQNTTSYCFICTSLMLCICSIFDIFKPVSEATSL